MRRIEKLTIDIKNSQYIELKFKQLDSVRLIINLLDNSKKISLTDHVADIIFRKPNNQIIIQDAIIDQNQNIVIDLYETCLRINGRAEMEVEIKNNSNEIVSSFIITIQIEKTNKENITPENTPNYIESMQKAIDELNQEGINIKTEEALRKKSEIERQKEETERIKNETNRIQSEELRVSSETKRISAEQNREKSENSRKLSEDKRISEEIARNQNEEKRKTAETARENAEKARAGKIQKNTDDIAEINNKIIAINEGRGHIYGIKRKKSDLNGNKNTSSKWQRILDSVGLIANATHDGSFVKNDFDNIYPWSEIKTVNYDVKTKNIISHIGDSNFKFDGTNGEVLTRIPTHWQNRFVKEESDGIYEYILIADYEAKNFTKINTNYYGRYEISLSSNNVAHSISEAYPKYNYSKTNFDIAAKNLEEGFIIEDWRRFALANLYLVEYADYNSQEKLGRGITEFSEKKAIIAENNVNRIIVDNANVFYVGRTICIGISGSWNAGVAADRTITNIENFSSGNIVGQAIYFDGTPVNVAEGNTIWGSAQKSGQCDSLGMRSGCLVNDGRHSVAYRGIENLQGNTYKFLTGLNIYDYQTYVNYNPTTYTENKHDGIEYKKLAYSNPINTEGWGLNLGYDPENPLIAFTEELGASSNTGLTDYCYSKNAGDRVPLVGGGFLTGGSAGLFYYSFYFSAGSSYWHIGARLFKPE